MRILMINSVCGIGSTGRICTDLAEELEAQGHEVKIAYGRESVPEKYQKYAVRIGTDFSVKIDALKTRIFDNAGFNSKKATQAFIKWVEGYDPDVIHLHNIHGYYINIEILFQYLARANKPVIWTLHDCWAFTGHCSHFDFVGCDKWEAGCNKCSQKSRYPASFMFDNSCSNWKKKKELFTSVQKMTITTPSHWLANRVNKSFLKHYSVQVIHNGIDTDIFKPTPSDFREHFGLTDKKIILGVASTWNDRKGFDDFIQLSKELSPEYHIVLVGLSPKQMKSLPDNILGITRTNSTKELAEIYTAADVYVNPSKEETFGLTTVEAVACGTPVVVSNLTAIPEVVCTANGIILHSLKPQKILSAIQNCALFTKENIRQTAFVYKKEKQYERYLNIYENIHNI